MTYKETTLETVPFCQRAKFRLLFSLHAKSLSSFLVFHKIKHLGCAI